RLTSDFFSLEKIMHSFRSGLVCPFSVIEKISLFSHFPIDFLFADSVILVILFYKESGKKSIEREYRLHDRQKNAKFR
ncbi:MAG: hypothetical protein IJK23_02205, partial [Clostridia bacterium]|nr:hypothetical protein [Clostridia bacterium]